MLRPPEYLFFAIDCKFLPPVKLLRWMEFFSKSGTQISLTTLLAMVRPISFFQDLQSLPETDKSGLYPLAFINGFRSGYRYYYENADARKILVESLRLSGSAQADAISFVLALSACRRWRNDESRYAGEKRLNNLIKRCQRRAKQRMLPSSIVQVKQLPALRLLFRLQTIAKWQAFITWGFACASHPEEPSWRVLEDFEAAVTTHAYNMQISRLEHRTQMRDITNSIRANIFRYRRQLGERSMAKLSKEHFVALQEQLTRRGIIPSAMRIGNW